MVYYILYEEGSKLSIIRRLGKEPNLDEDKILDEHGKQYKSVFYFKVNIPGKEDFMLKKLNLHEFILESFWSTISEKDRLTIIDNVEEEKKSL